MTEERLMPENKVKWNVLGRDYYECIGGSETADGRTHGECSGHFPGPDCPYCWREEADDVARYGVSKPKGWETVPVRGDDVIKPRAATVHTPLPATNPFDGPIAFLRSISRDSELSAGHRQDLEMVASMLDKGSQAYREAVLIGLFTCDDYGRDIPGEQLTVSAMDHRERAEKIRALLESTLIR